MTATERQRALGADIMKPYALSRQDNGWRRHNSAACLDVAVGRRHVLATVEHPVTRAAVIESFHTWLDYSRRERRQFSPLP